MCLSPATNNYIAVGSSDSHIRIYDRRYLSLIDFTGPASANPTEKHTKPVKTFSIPSLEKRHFRVTSINFSEDESELLVSYSSDHLYLFDVTKPGIGSGMDRMKQRNSNPKVLASTSSAASGSQMESPPPVRRLRLRGDWSDTGPEARPEREMAQRSTMGQARPQLQATIMHRMTEVLSRMLADPRTRIGLSAHGNEISQEHDLASVVQQLEQTAATTSTSTSDNDTEAGSSGSAAQRSVIEAADDDEAPSDENRSADQMNVSLEDMEVDIELDARASTESINNFDYMKMKFLGHRNARYITIIIILC